MPELLFAAEELSLAIGQKGKNKERLMREFEIEKLVFYETVGSVGITVWEIE